MMGYGGAFGLLGGLGMGLGMIFWIVLVAAIVWMLVSVIGRSTVPAESPLEILKRRYARGEISEAEFERARERLT